MTLRSESCTIELVSKVGRELIDGDDEGALVAFTRETLSCPRMKGCAHGDYCTIFAASLLAERGRVSESFDNGAA